MNLISGFLQLIDGKKSYLTAVLLVILSGLLAQGYIDQKTYEVVVTLLGGLGLVSIKSAIKKLE